MHIQSLDTYWQWMKSVDNDIFLSYLIIRAEISNFFEASLNFWFWSFWSVENVRTTLMYKMVWFVWMKFLKYGECQNNFDVQNGMVCLDIKSCNGNSYDLHFKRTTFSNMLNSLPNSLVSCQICFSLVSFQTLLTQSHACYQQHDQNKWM